MTLRSTSRSADGESSIEFERRLGPPALLLGVTGLIIVVVPLAIYPHLESRFGFFVVLSATFAVIAGVGWIALRLDGVTARAVGLGREHILPGVLAVLGLYVLLNAVGAGTVLVSGEAISIELSDEYASAGMWAVAGIAYLAFNGMAEEFAFRGYLQNKVIALFGGSNNRIRKAGAIFAGVLLFALIHIPQRVLIGGVTSPVAIAQSLLGIVLLGLVLGVLYEYTRNVVFVGVLHGTFNWQPIVVAGAPVSELALVVGIPVLVLTAWYYRRWASGKNAPEFSPQRQLGVSR
jgi:membrane protease YdiL (CAAX protease family)